ncbi:autotransporter outer membrane beta-barrel domain-containing protein, partial [Succinatimonas hippei]|uniref:autotransporter outer membrane beta-barrel domain-containing protein n=1 Tax=Succinatimonas hippei TaxID=626938 RepID=UPI0026E92364
AQTNATAIEIKNGGQGKISSDVTSFYAKTDTTPQKSGLIDLDNLNINTVGIKLVNNANLTVSKSEQSGVSTFATRNNPEASAVVSDSAGVYVEDSYYESKQAAHIIRAGATNSFADSTTQASEDWNRILNVDPTKNAYNEQIDNTNNQLLNQLNALASDNKLSFGDNIAINSIYNNSDADTEETLRGVSYQADSGNAISGAVIAYSKQGSDNSNNKISIITEDGNNYILSSATIKDKSAQTQTDTDEGEVDKSKVHTAVYALGAESDINIKSTNGWNFIMTNAPDETEHVVRASNGGDITISGNTFVSAYANYDDAGFINNNVGLALVAGTAEYDQDKSLNEIKVNADDENNYHTYIFGDIAAGRSGSIQISNKDSEGATFIRGNVLAANGGSVDLNLGTNGIWIGRGDDYGDASADSDHGTSFYNPAFSHDITNSGTVNVTMGANSKWYLTGQSWISSLTTTGTADIYMSNNVASTEAADGIYDKTHALLIGKLSGCNNDATFHMSLNNEDHSVSDMLYIREINEEVNYKVDVLGVIEGFEFLDEDNQLRFATVKGNSSVFADQYVKYYDRGINNWVLQVNVVEHVDSVEDEKYNGDSLSSTKPGNDNLDAFFNNDSQTEISTFALAAKQDDSETLYDYYLTKVTDVPEDPAKQDDSETLYDYYLTKVTDVPEDPDPEDPDNPDNPDPDNPNPDDPVNPDTPHGPVLSDAAHSVINMSRANYATAVYMDTLNKRQGEARFANGSDNGVWVRLRHDNIGKDDSFRTHDTMVEVGFDQGIALESGSLHTGVAFDYMNGQIDYHAVDGDGDIDRYGVWFYTTYLGNNGQYADLVLKYGHLKNDFGFNTKSLGEHVSGDYSNDVASISAEYGWKFSNSNNYYIEPQAQLQYSYVTGADYTTSQGTKVELESIHSLIGRVGFRAGKDFNTETPITAYIRGDVLHEFLGDQDIYASDPTGVMDVTYENDDTWYSAGVGL